jgi:hypothetical protein
MALALCTAAGAHANLSFTEDFSGGSMPSNLETTGNFDLTDNIVFGDGTAKFNGQGDNQRQYLRTTESDYFAADFVMEVTYNMSGDGWWEAAWIGMGDGTFDPGNFNGTTHPRIGVQLGGTGASGGIQLFDNAWLSPTGAPAWDADTAFTGPKTHRVRMTYTTANQNMSVEIDQDYAGGAFVTDISSVWTTSDNGDNSGQFDASNSHIFMGAAGNGSYFDDLTVTVIPEPATLGLVALLGGGMLWIRKRFTS